MGDGQGMDQQQNQEQHAAEEAQYRHVFVNQSNKN